MQPKIFPAAAFLLTASLLLALFCGLGAFNSALAQSPPLAPDAPGSISGSVTDSSGAPLSGIDVTLHRRDSNGYYSYWRSTRTDTQGAYRFGVLPAGTYALSFRDQSSVYAQTFYSNALTLQSATPIAVAGSNVTDLNVAMPKAGAIQGQISYLVSGFVQSSRINVLARVQEEWQTVASLWIEGSGVYSFPGLQPGVYAICAYNVFWDSAGDKPSESYPTLCYPDVYSSIDYAWPVTVTEGLTTTDIDLAFGVEGDSATIGGVVRSSVGSALEGILVHLFSRNSSESSQYSAMTRTDAAGRYEFRWLRPGNYVLLFIDLGGPYLGEFYDDSVSYSDATVVTVNRYEKRLDVDARLSLGGAIGGKLSVLGDEKPDNAYIQLLGAPPPSWWFPLGYSHYDPATGAYRVSGIPPGIYRMRVEGQLNHMTFGAYYGEGAGRYDPEQATPITITPGAVIDNINIDLGEAGMFDGAIGGQIRAEGRPLPSARVSLYASSDKELPLVELQADAEGRYFFGGLTEGTYRIGVVDPLEIYATTFYSDRISPVDASLVSLEASQQRMDVDIELKPGGWITGRVIADNNRPAARFNVYAWYVLQNPGAEYAYGTLFPLIQRATTDQNGNYRLGGLRAGSYRLCTGPGGRFPGGLLACFGLPPRSIEPYQAANVEVRAGQTTAGIDMFVGERLPSNSYLPLLMR